MSARLGIRIVAIALASVAYIVGCHWLMTRAHASPWNVVGVLTPMLLALAIGAWRGGQHLLGGIAAILIVALCGQALLGVQVPPQLLYVAQHAGIHAFLACMFGATLRAGRTPLITTLAARVHRRLTDEMVVYTRKCTLAWTLYFIAMAAISLALYAVAPFDAWAFFANLLTPLTLVAMFVGEYQLRYWLHPDFERASFADAIRSYRHGGAE